MKHCLKYYVYFALGAYFFSLAIVVNARKLHPCSDPSSCFLHGLSIPRLKQYVHDVIQLHEHIISWDSFKIVTATFPFFVGVRMIDEKVQRYFYNPDHHKNINQFPKWCGTAAKVSIGIPITLFIADAFFSTDSFCKRMGWIFMAGMPFVIFGKDIIKKWRFDSALRPWHEDFSCEQRSSGGFPSGHMAEIVFMTTLYGLAFGASYAIPLSGLGLFLGACFINCNRHYASQLIAGGVLGAVYGVAAYKLTHNTEWQAHNISLGLSCNLSTGAPALTLAYCF